MDAERPLSQIPECVQWSEVTSPVLYTFYACHLRHSPQGSPRRLIIAQQYWHHNTRRHNGSSGGYAVVGFYVGLFDVVRRADRCATGAATTEAAELHPRRLLVHGSSRSHLGQTACQSFSTVVRFDTGSVFTFAGWDPHIDSTAVLSATRRMELLNPQYAAEAAQIVTGSKLVLATRSLLICA